METMKRGAGMLGLVLLGLALACEERSPLSVSAASRVDGISASVGGTNRAAHIRWDLVNLNFPPPLEATAGGSASSKSLDGARITFTGSGTFVAPTGRDGTSNAVTGGGTWMITAGTATPAGSGTYRVTGLVRWELAPGTLPVDDGIGNVADTRAGLAILRIQYSDGSQGILVVGCRLAGTPESVTEGITATKGLVDFWNHEEPAGLVEGNRTLFHVVRSGVE